MTFGWNAQLAVGSRGEELLLQNYHEPLVVYPERKADFKRLSDGKLVELKTDTYCITKTENFFFERYSGVAKKEEKPGGPWRARRDRVGVFVYYYARHNLYWDFADVKALCKRLEKLTKGMGLIFVKNRGYITGGYKICRADVEDLATLHHFIPGGSNVQLTPEELKVAIEQKQIVGVP